MTSHDYPRVLLPYQTYRIPPHGLRALRYREGVTSHDYPRVLLPILADQSVLITGGAGSFGQAFARRALTDGARRVIVYSRDEAKHAAMRVAFEDDPVLGDLANRLRFFVGDVRDAVRFSDAVRNVDIVVHAAAMKRVETCEADPCEAVATNVHGTANVIRGCIERGVKQAVLLSTDKAASPATTYGASKLMAERLWLGGNVYAAGTPTKLSAVRYGNVLGSRGSVVPLFRAQAKAGLFTLTDHRATRFWMTMADAVDLVVMALDEMRGGEIFVPVLGAAPVAQLAAAVAYAEGQRDVRMECVGLRPGEKLHEVLITEHEARRTYYTGASYIIWPELRTWDDEGDAPRFPNGDLRWPRVAEDFTYRSDTADALTTADLAEMVAA